MSKGTFLAKQVEKYGSGYAVDVSDDKNIIDLVHQIENEIVEKTEKMERIDRMEAVDNCEELMRRVKGIEI